MSEQRPVSKPMTRPFLGAKTPPGRADGPGQPTTYLPSQRPLASSAPENRGQAPMPAEELEVQDAAVSMMTEADDVETPGWGLGGSGSQVSIQPSAPHDVAPIAPDAVAETSSRVQIDAPVESRDELLRAFATPTLLAAVAGEGEEVNERITVVTPSRAARALETPFWLKAIAAETKHAESPSETARHVADALANLAARVRSGEIGVDGVPHHSESATLAALLAVLLSRE